MFPINRRTWFRLLEIAKALVRSPVRGRALGALVLIVALLLALNGLNVLNSYVGRGFMTSLAERHADRYFHFALFYLAVFAASTVVTVYSQFVQDRLALLLRQWLTCHLVSQYLARQAYFRINSRNDIDNPDQRISEDARSFTTTLLSFFLVIFNATITTVAFAGVLWLITPWLLVAAVLYSLFGTVMAVVIGRRLVELNNQELKKEADLRYGLVHVREYAEPIALAHGERQEEHSLRRRIKNVVDVYKSIIAVNRNLGFFTSAFNYLTPILPIFIVAPYYMRGAIEFGVVTQSAMAFAQIVGAFSVIVVQFQNISTFAAVVNRLGSLWEAIHEEQAPSRQPIEIINDPSKVAYDRVTLRTAREGRLLVRDLSLEIPRGRRVLITGVNGAGKSALLRATAGVWSAGEGRITRPPRDQLVFVTQHPFVMSGSLREQLLYGLPRTHLADERLVEKLRDIQLEDALQRAGGLDAPRDWPSILSAGEQELLAIARLLLVSPPFAYLDHPSGALSFSLLSRCYDLLAATSITYISIGEENRLQDYHDTVLELQEAGRWSVRPTRRAASA